MGIKRISNPASPCSGWKAESITQLDTLRVALGGQRILLTFESSELVGRSLAASTPNGWRMTMRNFKCAAADFLRPDLLNPSFF